MEAVAPTLAYASPGRRLLAALIDNFVVSFLTSPFAGSASQRFAESLVDGKSPGAGDIARVIVTTVVTIVVYSTAMHAWRGATLGKIAARIEVVNDDGTKVTPAVAFVRGVALAAIFFGSTLLFSLPMLVNFLWPVWHRRRQTWHDMLAHTVVVRADTAPAAAPDDAPQAPL